MMLHTMQEVYLANSEPYSYSAADGGGIKSLEELITEEEYIMFINQQCICHNNVGRGSGMFILIESPMTYLPTSKTKFHGQGALGKLHP